MTLRGVPSFSDYLKAVQPNLNVEPGTVFDYQTINTEVLGLIIEKVSGMSLNQYMTLKLWANGAESDAFYFPRQKTA